MGSGSRKLDKAIEKILKKRLPDIRKRESQLKHAKDIDALWCEEVKAAKKKANGIFRTMWRNKGSIALSTVAGFVNAGPVGALFGALGTLGYKLYKKK